MFYRKLTWISVVRAGWDFPRKYSSQPLGACSPPNLRTDTKQEYYQKWADEHRGAVNKGDYSYKHDYSLDSWQHVSQGIASLLFPQTSKSIYSTNRINITFSLSLLWHLPAKRCTLSGFRKTEWSFFMRFAAEKLCVRSSRMLLQ